MVKLKEYITCGQGDRFHLLPSYGIAEIVRDDGTLIESPNEVGYVVSHPRHVLFVNTILRHGFMGRR